MIKHITSYDHDKKEWVLTPRLTFRSKYKTYFKREFQTNNYNFGSPFCKTNSPLLGPTCLTGWSK